MRFLLLLIAVFFIASCVDDVSQSSSVEDQDSGSADEADAGYNIDVPLNREFDVIDIDGVGSDPGPDGDGDDGTDGSGDDGENPDAGEEDTDTDCDVEGLPGEGNAEGICKNLDGQFPGQGPGD